MLKKQRSDGSGFLWLVQAVSGALLLGLLVLHLVANHFIVEGGLQTYDDVVRYLRNPVVLPLEVLFLIVVTAHAMLGVRAVALDLGISNGSERRLNIALAAIGVGMIVYGLWLAWLIVS